MKIMLRIEVPDDSPTAPDLAYAWLHESGEVTITTPTHGEHPARLTYVKELSP